MSSVYMLDYDPVVQPKLDEDTYLYDFNGINTSLIFELLVCLMYITQDLVQLKLWMSTLQSQSKVSYSCMKVIHYTVDLSLSLGWCNLCIDNHSTVQRAWKPMNILYQRWCFNQWLHHKTSLVILTSCVCNWSVWEVLLCCEGLCLMATASVFTEIWNFWRIFNEADYLCVTKSSYLHEEYTYCICMILFKSDRFVTNLAWWHFHKDNIASSLIASYKIYGHEHVTCLVKETSLQAMHVIPSHTRLSYESSAALHQVVSTL